MVPFLCFIIGFVLWPGQLSGTSHLLPILFFGGFVLFTKTPLDSNCLHSAGSSYLHWQGYSSKSHKLLNEQLHWQISIRSGTSQVVINIAWFTSKKSELQLSLGNLKSRHHPHTEYHRRPCKRNVISRKPNLEWGTWPCQKNTHGAVEMTT